MLKLLNLVIKRLENFYELNSNNLMNSQLNDLIEIKNLIKEIKSIYNKNRF